MDEKKKFDANIFSHQLLLAGMIGMIDDTHVTPHQVLEIMEDAKRQLWSAMQETYREKQQKNRP